MAIKDRRDRALGEVHGEDGEKIEDYRFLKKGHVDSMGLIKFILSLENAFNITITEKDTTSKNFGIIKGLTKIIKTKLKN